MTTTTTHESTAAFDTIATLAGRAASAADLLAIDDAVRREIAPGYPRLRSGRRPGLDVVKHYDELGLEPGTIVVALVDGGPLPYSPTQDGPEYDDVDDPDAVPRFRPRDVEPVLPSLLAAGPRALAFRVPPGACMRVDDLADRVDHAARASGIDPPARIDLYVEPDRHARLVAAFVRDPFCAAPRGAKRAWHELSHQDRVHVVVSCARHCYINIHRFELDALYF